jgi:protein phosphatase-4 regulatory subunit 3
LQYLKEVVLARLLDDPTFGILNGFIFFNQVDIVGHIQSDESLLIELFSRFRNGNEPNEPNAGASLDEKKRDTVMFLHQLMLMGKQIQVPTRLALYRNLLDRGLLSVCEWAFQRHEAQILHAAAEMLTLVVDHDVNAVRGHVLKEEADKRPTLIVEMVQLMTATKNLGLLSQMSDILKTLLETAPEGEVSAATVATGVWLTRQSFVQKREGPTAESFVTFFYDSCAARLFVPLLELPEITNSSEQSCWSFWAKLTAKIRPSSCLGNRRRWCSTWWSCCRFAC